MDDILIVTTVVDSRAVADALANSVVAGRLAACVQVSGPVESTYWWQGRVETATEWSVQCKTTAASSERLVAHLRDGHPYDTPEILITPVLGGNPDYLAWVRAETAATD